MASSKDRVSAQASGLQDRMSRVTKMATETGRDPSVRPRSQHEQDNMWAQTMGLPKEERMHLLTQMVARSGHTDGEDRPCDLCKFVSYQGAKGTSDGG